VGERDAGIVVIPLQHPLAHYPVGDHVCDARVDGRQVFFSLSKIQLKSI
jgi:hypothetical protein